VDGIIQNKVRTYKKNLRVYAISVPFPNI